MPDRLRPFFWKTQSLSSMTDQEWEALCDRCGRCCLHKLEDVDTKEHHYTDISCKLYDLKKQGCSQYKTRFERVPNCMNLRPVNPDVYRWLPTTCAYRRLWEGQSLPTWHPLVSGRRSSVIEAGAGISPWAFDEKELPPDPDWEEHIIRWVDESD